LVKNDTVQKLKDAISKSDGGKEGGGTTRPSYYVLTISLFSEKNTLGRGVSTESFSWFAGRDRGKLGKTEKGKGRRGIEMLLSRRTQSSRGPCSEFLRKRNATQTDGGKPHRNKKGVKKGI